MREIAADEQMELMRACAILERRIHDNLSVIETMGDITSKYRILKAVDSMMEVCVDAAGVKSDDR